jgi:ArsR family transcriptional regulator
VTKYAKQRILYLDIYLIILEVISLNETFKALADPTRRQILRLLRKGDLTAGEIAEHFNMTKPSISHHLNLLKQARLVLSERQGQYIVYSLNTTVVQEVLRWLMEISDTPNSKE